MMKRSAYHGYNTISNNISNKWCLLLPTRVKKDIKSLFFGLAGFSSFKNYILSWSLML